MILIVSITFFTFLISEIIMVFMFSKPEVQVSHILATFNNNMISIII